MPAGHLEAMLLWSDAGPSPAAEQWLVERGLQTMPMRAGLLVMGSQANFEQAFGVDLNGQDLPFALPVPDALRDIVGTISIRRPPDYSQGG